ncbi:MAG: transcriptional regulator, TetR family [Marmoricola sp.]|nr:transcriptional regulator, TetR family [Marmoricola sp.]
MFKYCWDMAHHPAETRQLILDTALRLFEERGYAGTTMRAIATEAGVSPSNAYYWFRSKDELVQAFYNRIQDDHRDRVADALAGGGSLTERLAAVEHGYLDVIGRYHGFGMAFLATALGSEAGSPFSAASTEPREKSVAIYADLVAGATPAVPAKLAGTLPELLWLCHLGITLFWVADRSADQQRTRRLVEATVPLVLPLVRVAKLPWAGSAIDQVRRAMAVALDREPA